MARAPFCIVERKTAAGRVFLARFYDSDEKIIKSKTFPEARSAAASARKAAPSGASFSQTPTSMTRCILNKHLAPHLKGKRFLDLDADFMESRVLSLSASA